MEKPQSLLVFSIGPVQSFIASARKTEDLWSGSYLLSYLAEKAILFLYEQAERMGKECEMIYPDVKKEELLSVTNIEEMEIASLPNRFLCRLGLHQEQAAALAREAEEEVRRVMEEFCLCGYHLVFKDAGFPREEEMKELIRRQIHQTLEVYWATEAYNGDPHEGYKEARGRLEQRLAALKNDRVFSPVLQNGLVCTVCGEREALCAFPFSETDRVGRMRELLRQTWQKRHWSFRGNPKAEDPEAFQGRIRDDEMLCGICLGRRTARDYFKEVRQNHKAYGSFPSTLDFGQGTGYYAILMMDGDNMGAWFNEGKGRTDKETELAYHQRLSRKLANFSRKTVPTAVKKCNGRLVYSGGDDVLAFVPLHQALDLAITLREAFESETEGLGETATASMGLIIAHVKAPLQILLSELRKLEALAKSYVRTDTQEEKNALAIQLSTRSGEKRQVVIPWYFDSKDRYQDDNGNHSVIALYQEIITHLKQELSSTFLYTFGQAFLPLVGAEYKGKLLLFTGKHQEGPEMDRELVETELKRLIDRSKQPNAKKLDVARLARQMATLHAVMPTTLSFVHLLEIATFFRRKDGEESHGRIASTR